MVKKIPIRLDYYQYCIETWIEILKQLHLNRVKTIIDLCCGWAPKLEVALLKTSFTGQVILIDKSQNHVSCLEHLLDPFPKDYTFDYCQLDIIREKKTITYSADVVFANHIIDDILIDQFLRSTGQDLDYVLSDINQLRLIWQDLIKDESLVNFISESLKDVIKQLVKKNGLLIISQYEGYQEKLYGFAIPHQICFRLMKRLEINLSQEGFKEFRTPIDAAYELLKNPYFAKNDIICLRHDC